MAALTLQDVRRSYGTTNVQQVLKDIDLVVEDGEFIILVGPSGCGKSTLLNLIAGLDVPTAGRVFIGGRDVTEVPSKDRDIAMVFQSYALYPNMTVAQNIAFGLEIRKVPKPQRRAAVQRVAQMLQIGPLLDRKPSALSGGQRQRVAMGRALAREPKLFLFDEPLSNLDAKLRVEMRAEIKRLHQRTRTTTVYVTHDQVEAMTLGDRIAVMNGGVIEQLGTPAEIYGRPATRFVAEFIGSPAMNLLNARRSAAGLQAAGAATDDANGALDRPVTGVELPMSAALRQALQADAGRSEFVYGLRPEDVSLAADGFLPGSLVMLEPTGPETCAMVETAAGVLTARLPGQLPLKMGDVVRLAWQAERAHLFDARSGARVA